MTQLSRASLALTMCVAACAAARPSPLTVSGAVDDTVSPPRAIRGTLRYEARHPTAQGASRELELRPARFVTVAALDARGVAIAECPANAGGAFDCMVPGKTRVLAVLAHARTDGHDASCTADSELRQLHAMRVPMPEGDAPMDIVARDDASGAAGAFHIVDTALTGLQTVKRWTGETLPPLVVYWGRGVTTEWSYYRGERPARAGRYLLELLGGQPGRQASSDTDEHDEAIVLHELGHFVMDRLSTNSSPGGTHPSNTLIDPGLAWEEGRATWFAAAVRRDARYQDTLGLEPGGSLRVNHDLERSAGPRGNGAESSVADILWDLTDGTEGYADRDDDGIALGPEAILRAMTDLRRQPGLFPCLSSFLSFITASQPLEGAPTRAPLLAPAALTQLLARTGEPAMLLDRAPEAQWPRELELPGRVRDKIDGLSNPCPSGGPRRPENGLDAVRVYRVRVTTRAWLSLELRIQGSGAPNDHTDLDMELRDIRGEVLSSARETTTRETLSRLLQPGWYIVYVRDGGNGNRANFELFTRVRPV